MRSRGPSVVISAVCILLAIFLALNGRDAAHVRNADQAGREGRFDEAVQIAGRAQRSPAQARALVTIARAHTAAGRLEEADQAWAAAARRDPNNWRVHFEWARAIGILQGPADRREAAYARARELNPKLPPAPG